MSREQVPRIEPSAEQRLLRANRWLAALAACSVSLAAGAGVLALRSAPATEAALLLDPQLREAAVNRLVAEGAGVWDSFPDPDVARILQPGLAARSLRGDTIDSNALGLRERPFALPKEDGVVRVVLLGDSFVFGAGVDAADRFGVFLERYLAQRSAVAPGPRVECLHIGIGSWNIRSEVAFARRLLAPLDPDLVVHVLVANDLGDTGDVRGFGSVSDFSSQHRERTASIYTAFPISGLRRGFGKLSRLNEALGYESRLRYADGARDLGALARALRQRGSGYLLVLSWEHEPEIAARLLSVELDADSILHLPASFRRSPEIRLSGSDPHWSRNGHDQMARLLYGAIQVRELLPSLRLEEWPEAAALFERIQREGRREAAAPFDPDRRAQALVSRLAIDTLDEDAARQIYGGVYGDGSVAPYAALLLRRGEATAVRIAGRSLGRPELTSKVEVFADETRLGELHLPAAGAFDVRYDLPPEIVERPSFDVRFIAGDYLYAPDNIRRCLVFELDLVEVLP